MYPTTTPTAWAGLQAQPVLDKQFTHPEKPLRIAQVAPLAEAVPPRLYGGTERVVAWLTEELVARGHDVTLFASGDSLTSAKLVVGCPQALRLAGVKDHMPATLMMLADVRRRAAEFDIIHFHTDILQFPLFQDIADKTVTTLHNSHHAQDFRVAYEAYPQMPLVSISDSYREGMPDGINWAATVLHGLPTSVCPFNPHVGKYLAFVGRMSPEKGPEDAIEIAIRTGLPLKMAAKINPWEREYFDAVIKPKLAHPLIEFVGEINDEQKCAFMGHALALLFPISWSEPFGLVMAEAMSAGTPVIAYNTGSVPEIVKEGVSGFVVENVADAVHAVRHAPYLPRLGVRQHFAENFTTARMADDYLRVYHQLLGLQPTASLIPWSAGALTTSRIAA